MSEKLTVEELVKTLRCCTVEMNCTGCPLNDTENCGVIEIARKAADALESLATERDAYRDKLKAALAENTRLAEKLAVKSEQLESLRTIFYEVTGSVPSKASQPVPLPKPPKEENNA